MERQRWPQCFAGARNCRRRPRERRTWSLEPYGHRERERGSFSTPERGSHGPSEGLGFQSASIEPAVDGIKRWRGEAILILLKRTTSLIAISIYMISDLHLGFDESHEALLAGNEVDKAGRRYLCRLEPASCPHSGQCKHKWLHRYLGLTKQAGIDTTGSSRRSERNYKHFLEPGHGVCLSDIPPRVEAHY